MGLKKWFKKKPVHYFPDVRKIVAYAIPWDPHVLRTANQGINPNDSQLANKLGIKPKEKIIVVAGGAGDWARGLSKTNPVRYTDLSKPMTRFAEKEKRGPLSFHARPAEIVVTKPNQFDWTFSFEPYPLGANLKLVLVRSLLNRKGGKIVESNYSTLKKYLAHIAEMYGAHMTVEAVHVNNQVFHPNKVEVATLLSNPRARQKAWADVRLLKQLTLALRRKRILVPSEVCKKLKISKQELRESSARLSAISFWFPVEQSEVLTGPVRRYMRQWLNRQNPIKRSKRAKPR
ncbi:MAG: class I SAM-dependent methyltransferase [Candidatus Diapherotrites archaeon]|uniref:Class I SAM-dependent methyltransferase n=1 Tax=Candidatus Iainarchaeum sp. TaxID=3101447 RepID=A0A8T4L5I9_9ARCH|nr:class I SAM-dependent methyltransferase [Candidatus Diapherotrites archaeon]